ncbi:MAG: hypothetical protein ACP6IP_06815 [Candidatus Njordarchaeia archaeon]
MTFFITLEELLSLTEEGRRGKYKAAKMLKNLDPSDINTERLLELIKNIFEEKDEQLNEILIDKLTSLSLRIPTNILEELIGELTGLEEEGAERLTGITILRNLNRIDPDIALELSKRLIKRPSNNRYLGLAILKDLGRKVNKYELEELVEELLKQGSKEDLLVALRILDFMKNKLAKNDILAYIDYIIGASGENLEEILMEEEAFLLKMLGKKRYEEILYKHSSDS